MIKFGALMSIARDLGAEALATGHYARRVTGAKGAELHRAEDAARDQSYFLFAVEQEQLDFLRFPLGGMTSKAETRRLAERFGLPVAAKPDSQDICFVPNGDYAALVSRLRPEKIAPGDIVDEKGNVLGRHKGIIHFTVGQRRGIHRLDAQQRVHRPLVFHLQRQLHDEVAVGRPTQQPGEVGVVQLVTVVIRMQPDTGHPMDLDAASQFFVPVGRLGVDAAEREEQAAAMLASVDCTQSSIRLSVKCSWAAATRSGSIIWRMVIETSGVPPAR